MALLKKWAYDLILLDLRMPDMDGMTVLQQILSEDPQAVVIMITGHGSIQTAVEAMKAGAADFLPKPFTPAELRRAVNSALERRDLRQENAYLREELRRAAPPRHVVSASPAMQEVLQMLDRVAPTEATVLLTGESGTGKGLLSRQLHALSPRAGRPFVHVDCSTLVPTLIESELFGHVKGAFTGAQGDKPGKFEVAQGGTLFLDEVSNISLDIQAKLLRAVEERAVTRVGSNRVIQADVRLVAASNQDLSLAVKEGAFRRDLYYRLNVVHIHLPPLRERPEDIQPMAETFLQYHRRRNRNAPRRFATRAMQALTRMPWPGNVRELDHTVERLSIMCRSDVIDLEDLRACQAVKSSAQQVPPTVTLAEMERNHILTTLKRMGGRRGDTAQALGIDRKTLRNKLDRYLAEDEGKDAAGNSPG
jgi:DNA-binding NtrC family response regulator